MPAHGFTFDSARRVAELILLAQMDARRPIALYPLCARWGVSWRTVRRLADLAVEVSAEHPRLGKLRREGRGRLATMVWDPGAGPRGVATRADIVPLLAALGPWRAIGIEDVSDALERLLKEAMRGESRSDARQRLADLARRGFYYQPINPRRMRDPDAINDVLSALASRRALAVERYHAPEREVRADLVLDPWTLAHVHDGLYLIAPRRGTSEARLWAVHRMEGTRWLKDQPVTVPREYHPEDLLGHGYGPFVGEPGEVVLRVPAAEAPWVLESPLPGEIERRQLPDGSFRVQVGVGWNAGLDLWCRWMGVEIEEE